MDKNKLVILKGRYFCNECTRLIPIVEGEIDCILQNGMVICPDCYESHFKNRDDVLVVAD